MAQIVPVDQYDPIKAKFYASLRWLASKCSPDLLSQDVIASINSLYGFDPNDSTTIDLLTSGVIYSDVYIRLFEKNNNESTAEWLINNNKQGQLHSKVIEKLQQLGFTLTQNSVSSVTPELLAKRSSLQISAHVALIETMMDAYVQRMINICEIEQCIRQLTNTKNSQNTYSDFEDALLSWINAVCDLVNEENLNKNLPTVSTMFDLLKDLSDGCCLAAVIGYYRPSLVQLENIHTSKLTLEDKVENLLFVKTVCLRHLSRRLYIPSIEDIAYGFMMLKSNIIAFLSELYNTLVGADNAAVKDGTNEEDDCEKRVCSDSYDISSDCNPHKSSKSSNVKSNSTMLANVELSDSYSFDESESKLNESLISDIADITNNTQIVGGVTLLESDAAVASKSLDLTSQFVPLVIDGDKFDQNEASENSIMKCMQDKLSNDDLSPIVNDLSEEQLTKLHEARFCITAKRHELIVKDTLMKETIAFEKERVMQVTFMEALGIAVMSDDNAVHGSSAQQHSNVSFEVNLFENSAVKPKPNLKSPRRSNSQHTSKLSDLVSPVDNNHSEKPSLVKPSKQHRLSSPTISTSSITERSTRKTSKNTQSHSHSPISPTKENSDAASESSSSSHSFKSGRKLSNKSSKELPNDSKTIRDSRRRAASVTAKIDHVLSKANQNVKRKGNPVVNHVVPGNASKSDQVDDSHTSEKSISKGEQTGNSTKPSVTSKEDNSQDAKVFDFVVSEDGENKQRLIRYERLRHQKEKEDKARREAFHQAHEKRIEEKRKTVKKQREEAREHHDESFAHAAVAYMTVGTSERRQLPKPPLPIESGLATLPRDPKRLSAKSRNKGELVPAKINTLRRLSDGITSKTRNGSKSSTPISLSAANSRHGSSTSINSLGSESNLHTYVKPSVKSNKKVIVNAIEYVCLAGTVNKDQREHALSVMEESDSSNFMVLFRDHSGSKFRGLYAFIPDIEEAEKIFGTGPKVVLPKMVEKSFKYYTGAKQFREIPSKMLSVSVDAFSIHDSCWLHTKKAGKKGASTLPTN